jgi:NAD-dependent deacetylase
VVHLHGRLDAARCAHCAQPLPLPEPPPPSESAAGDGPFVRLAPPRCAACGGPARPGVVWFGEPLPPAALARAERAAERCDAMLVVGTAGLVYPAAALPGLAAARGVPVLQVNPQPSALDAQCTLNLRAPAAQLLPRLLAPC